MKKALVFSFTIFIMSVIIFQTFAQQSKPPQHDEKPTNLKVLPKDISEDSLHNLMKFYSKSLGVRCGYCHAQKKDDPKHLDFASDEKQEKNTAREMMKMTEEINEKYLHKIADGHLESITCVTCHMGRTTPIISTDSLSVKK
jgi:hypothetical protein